jgi:hypothetical protein
MRRKNGGRQVAPLAAGVPNGGLESNDTDLIGA